MSETFEVGDVVRLKSGGPAMTVEEVGDSPLAGGPYVHCTWFDTSSKKPTSKSFKPQALEKTRA